jgi:hypothetical protein
MFVDNLEIFPSKQSFRVIPNWTLDLNSESHFQFYSPFVAMKMPVFRGTHNEIDHVVTLHVLEYMKKHNLSPVQMMPQKSTHMILKRVDFEAALMDLNMEVKRRSDCILQDELVFLFEPIHKEDWAPFLKKVPNDKMSLTVDLTLYAIITGGGGGD